ncbi:PspC domain-containing protein [Sinomonas sp. ASV486]|uniref:PspC domain-containing protein n=1 Tax=Sinomonas sp. ASV486 TaxID=3051170 RepID=UPI0027DD0974|nr:PspC domain-containing protein [Sinomonas sp. ASV486]MDQ4488726.1 PspC domain-containing protein [Sinomonas sp. ASV486]
MSSEQTPGGQPAPQPQDDEPHPTSEPTRDESPHVGSARTDSPDSGSPRPGRAQPAPRGNDFFSWIRGLGVTRGGDRWMGGVASGLAHRWGVDPVLVRGLFIVAAIFLGIGVLAYGLLWLLLPEPDGRIHVQEAAHGRWTAGMTGGLIVTILGFGGARAGFWFGERGIGGAFWGLFWVAVVACCIFSIVRGGRRRSMRVGAGRAGYGSGYRGSGYGPYRYSAPHAAGTPPYATPTAGSESAGGVPTAGDPYYAKPTTPPSYSTDYSGYAGYAGNTGYAGSTGYAGDTGDAGYAGAPAAPPYYGGSVPPVPPAANQRPPRAPRPPRRPRASAPYLLVVLGMAALVAGALGALVATGAITLAASAVWTVVAIVIGLGILVAGLRGRRAGILTLFAIVALVASAATQSVDRFSNLQSRQSSYAPTSLQQAAGGYDLAAEKGTLDLSALDASGPLASETVIPVKTTMSDVVITVPKDIPVQVRTSSTMAKVQTQGQTSAGFSRHDTTTYNSGRPGSALVLQLDATLSNVTINEER